MKFRLTRRDRRRLSRIAERTKDRKEYVRATGLLMRWKGMKAREVADSLHVSISAVFRWEAILREHGVDGLRARKPSGRPAVNGSAARKLIPELMKKDPRAFGFLKGRWVVRDISKALKSEGVDIGPTQVHGILRDLGLSYKRPKLDVVSDNPSYARKARGLGRYEQVAPALAKRG